MDLDQTDPATIEAAVVTDRGTMVVTFFPEQAPKHVRNFLELAQRGFYDGLTFHRIVKGFVIQAGCPHSRRGATGMVGTGGSGQRLAAEFSDLPHTRGTLSMARGTDPNSASSQFFVVHGEHASHLDGSYSVFGRVEEGLEVLDQIASVECGFGPNGGRDLPAERIEIRRIELRPRQERAPAAEPQGREQQGEA